MKERVPRKPAEFRHFGGNLAKRERVVFDENDLRPAARSMACRRDVPNAGKVVDAAVNRAERIIGEIQRRGALATKRVDGGQRREFEQFVLL